MAGLLGSAVQQFPTVATLSYPLNANATYTPGTNDPALVIPGAGATFVTNLDVWNPVAGEVITAQIHSVRNWSLIANQPNTSGGGVTCFPNCGADITPVRS